MNADTLAALSYRASRAVSFNKRLQLAAKFSERLWSAAGVAAHQLYSCRLSGIMQGVAWPFGPQLKHNPLA
jgi:hypothetical protein